MQIGTAGVDVAVAHFGDKEVAHGHLQIGIGVEDGIEGSGVARHVVVLQRERGELMEGFVGGLEVVGEFARDDVAFEIVAAIDDARGEFEQCGGGIEKAVMGK